MSLGADRRKFFLVLGVIVLVVAADQATKIAIDRHFVRHDRVDLGEGRTLQRRVVLQPPIEVVAGLFNLQYVENPGVTFGMLRNLDDSVRRPILLTIPTLVMVLLLFIIWKTPATEVVSFLGLSCIVSGAIGNLIDRVRLNYVIDFLDVYLGSYHWPSFNLADSAISVGMGLLVIEMLRGKEPFNVRRNKSELHQGPQRG
ncbi:MAG: signal peptidase II [Deltaproteobacteria bacterium RIFOXYA12_FULL_61_11]|nr:MAG: signal peptidase II [Deltaproteobacteria bacterium RIFOXYA12_FULL_61_11]